MHLKRRSLTWRLARRRRAQGSGQDGLEAALGVAGDPVADVLIHPAVLRLQVATLAEHLLKISHTLPLLVWTLGDFISGHVSWGGPHKEIGRY